MSDAYPVLERDPRFLASLRPGDRSQATKHSPAWAVLDVLGAEPLPGATTVRPAGGPEVDLVADPTERWPMPARSFGWVDVQTGLARRPAAEVTHVLREAYRVLRSGGKLTAVVPLAETRADDGAEGMAWSWGTPGYVADGRVLGSDNEASFEVTDRSATLSLTGDRRLARPLSALLRTASRHSTLPLALASRPSVRGRLAFTLKKTSPEAGDALAEERARRPLRSAAHWTTDDLKERAPAAAD